MTLAPGWELLPGCEDALVIRAREREDVLNDTILLVVRLFDEEAVVLDGRSVSG